jgi:hypothetical protein
LDRILPRNGVLYVANGRVSLIDAPPPIILTTLDLRHRAPIYRLTLKDLPRKEILDAASKLNCDLIVYSDTNAVVEPYGLPGKLLKTRAVTVRSCKIEVATPGGPAALD